MFEIVTGDLFSVAAEGIGHGVNQAGVMGAGIAPEFKRRWPEMYEGYRRKCLSGQLVPGRIFVWRDRQTGQYIYNLCTQPVRQGGGGIMGASVAFIEQAVRQMLGDAFARGLTSLAIPKIGCGLGGLQWEGEVRPAIERVAQQLTSVTLTVVEYAPGQGYEPGHEVGGQPARGRYDRPRQSAPARAPEPPALSDQDVADILERWNQDLAKDPHQVGSPRPAPERRPVAHPRPGDTIPWEQVGTPEGNRYWFPRTGQPDGGRRCAEREAQEQERP